MIRLFVGIDMPEEAEERLEDLGDSIPGVRWVPAENLHLTLRFIGEVDEGMASDIDEALSRLRVPAFEISLAGLGTFDRRGRVHSLWAGVEKNEVLTRLQGKVEAAMHNLGLERDRRKFTPHVTIARMRDVPAPRLASFLLEHSLFRAGPFPVESFVLFSSQLTPAGPIYTPEREYPLRWEAARDDTGARRKG